MRTDKMMKLINTDPDSMAAFKRGRVSTRPSLLS